MNFNTKEYLTSFRQKVFFSKERTLSLSVTNQTNHSFTLYIGNDVRPCSNIGLLKGKLLSIKGVLLVDYYLGQLTIVHVSNKVLNQIKLIELAKNIVLYFSLSTNNNLLLLSKAFFQQVDTKVFNQYLAPYQKTCFELANNSEGNVICLEKEGSVILDSLDKEVIPFFELVGFLDFSAANFSSVVDKIRQLNQTAIIKTGKYKLTVFHKLLKYRTDNDNKVKYNAFVKKVIDIIRKEIHG